MNIREEKSTSSGNIRKFVRDGERIYAITNWEGRKNKSDVAIIEPLNETQSVTYIEGKKKGHSDTTMFTRIYRQVNPKPETKEKTSFPYVKVHVSMLSKEQLICVVEQQLETQMPSLGKMSREDLVELLESIQRKLHGKPGSGS